MVRRTLLGYRVFYFFLPRLVSESLDGICPCLLNLDRGVARASDHRSNLRCYQQLALRNCVLGDRAGCGGYHVVIWYVDPPVGCEIPPDNCTMPVQRGSRENRQCLRLTRASQGVIRSWVVCDRGIIKIYVEDADVF